MNIYKVVIECHIVDVLLLKCNINLSNIISFKCVSLWLQGSTHFLMEKTE
jgi:hypothetical protein|nr:MAG TPA: hypothetical protein [Bacteriophage sp.]DAX10014.1 MAG TPA: hypothetical protein [Bacteriophage sp.]